MEYKRLNIIEEDYSKITRKRMVDVSYSGTGFLETRRSGEFEGKAYYLNETFDWVIGIDSKGFLVLVPLKKGE